MHTLQSEQRLIETEIALFEDRNNNVGGSVHRYDGETSPHFADYPHLDLNLWYYYHEAADHGRPHYTENNCTRLTKLTSDELLALVQFARDLAREMPHMGIALSRFDAGRCVFVVVPKAT